MLDLKRLGEQQLWSAREKQKTDNMDLKGPQIRGSSDMLTEHTGHKHSNTLLWCRLRVKVSGSNCTALCARTHTQYVSPREETVAMVTWRDSHWCTAIKQREKSQEPADGQNKRRQLFCKKKKKKRKSYAIDAAFCVTTFYLADFFPCRWLRGMRVRRYERVRLLWLLNTWEMCGYELASEKQWRMWKMLPHLKREKEMNVWYVPTSVRKTWSRLVKWVGIRIMTHMVFSYVSWSGMYLIWKRLMWGLEAVFLKLPEC